MYVVLLGAPGSGKGTQAPILADRIGGVHLSTGDMLREAVRRKTAYGRRANEYMLRGQLVPDAIVLGLVMERLSKPDAQVAFVLDGFPRNVTQAQELDEALVTAGKHLDVAIYIKVPRDVLVQRLSGRWTCSECQAIYHEVYSPPSRPGLCDRCGSGLHQRADDRLEAVERRLQVYLNETFPLVEYYRERCRLCEVDGDRSPDVVTTELLRALQSGRESRSV
jgi:adenylate kinase